MTIKKLITDESAITVAVETIIFFSISIIFMGMIFLSFQGMNQTQSSLLMEEQLMNIGNGIARKMSDMIVEARISNTLGSHTSMKSDFWIPEKIVDDTYSIKLIGSKILLESTTGTYVSVEVPIDSSIYLAQNSTIYSNDESHGLEYDSASGALFFTDGGVKPYPDFNAPSISIDSPAADATIFNITFINVTVWDDVGVTRVEYFVNGTYKYTASSPFNWQWNTRTMDDGGYGLTAVAYDAAGNTKPDTRNYTILNPISLPPEITVISPPNASSIDFHRPEIKAQITDDKGIDFSSIMLLVDGYNQIANATFSDNSSKLKTLSYIPAIDMNESMHNVTLRVKDIDTIIHTVIINWSFNVTVSPPNQSSELEINTNAPPVTSNHHNLQNIKVKDNVSDSVDVLINNVNISWNGGGRIEKVKFDSSTHWRYNGNPPYTPDGRQNSGTLLTLNPKYQATSSFEYMEIQLDSDVTGKMFTIVFYMSDGTTRTVSFSAP